jgi:hypothetical protein
MDNIALSEITASIEH